MQEDQASLQREFELELERKKRQESEDKIREKRKGEHGEMSGGKTEGKKAKASLAIEVKKERKQVLLAKAKDVSKALFSN